LGSGIPFIEINEDREEDMVSSDDDSEGELGNEKQDDFFQMDSNKIS
jgi:hypothetical protein